MKELGPDVRPAFPTSDVSLEGFSRWDVKTVLGHVDGENAGADWIAVLELWDGRFAFLSAGCDYTGWDCSCNGHAMVARSLAELNQFGITQHERERLAAAKVTPS